MAFQPSTLLDFQNWYTPLALTDKITSLQMVVRTGTSWSSGTGNTTSVSVNGTGFGLQQGGTGNGEYALYDLTEALMGNLISVLSQIPFRIQSSASVYYDSWQIESVAVFVNGRLLSAQNFNQWLEKNSDAVTGMLNP